MTMHRFVLLSLIGAAALGSGCDFVSGDDETFSAIVDGAEWDVPGYAFVNRSGRILVVGQEEGCGVCRSISLIGGEPFEGGGRYALEDSVGSGRLSYGGEDAVFSQYRLLRGSSSFEVTRYDAARERVTGSFSMVFVESAVTGPNDAFPDTIRVERGRFDLNLDRSESGQRQTSALSTSELRTR